MAANNIVRKGVGINSWQVDCSGGTSDTYGVLGGLVNSSNAVYTVSLGSYVSGSLRVYLNGQLQTQGSGEDWVETVPASGTFTFAAAPTTGDIIIAIYQFTTGSTGNADTLDGLHSSSLTLKSELVSGWMTATGTWTYNSADAINVPSGAASKYQKGDWIKITQTTDKFFKILAVADTVLTVTAGTTYTVADATITSPCYSHTENPFGVPGAFAWTPVWSLTSGTLTTTYTTQSGYFIISGGLVTFWWNLTLNSVSTATATKAFQINGPFSTTYMIGNVSGTTGACGISRYYDDSGGLQTTGQMVYYTDNLFQMKSLANDTAVGVTPNITLATGDRWGGQVTVPMA